MGKKTRSKKLPSPVVLQRAFKAVLGGKCNFSKPTYLKLKRHRNILRKLAAMKGNCAKKKAYITRNKKQVGGLVPLLPLIFSALGAAAAPLLKQIVR